MRLRAVSAGLWAARLLLAVSAAGGAAAQTVEVRSGEHPGFSRLVLDIGAGRDWRLEGEGTERRLALDPAPEGFDVSTVFDLIPRSRLAGLAVEDGLRLSLACACPVEASRYRDRYLVLDIRDAPPSPSGDAAALPAADPRAVARLAAAESLPDLTRLLTGDPAGQPVLPRAGAAGIPGAAAPPLVPRSEAPSAAATEIDLEAAARIMAEQLARAAASGLLDAAPARPLSDADPVTPPAADPAALAPPVPNAATPAPDPDGPPPELPIRAETALDAALHRVRGTEAQQNRLTCAGAALSLGDWAAGPDLGSGLGSLRRMLYDDRDRLQRETVLALARHYLHFGFGAEAAHWLGRIGDAPRDLLVIAALVDDRPGPHFPPEPDPTICSEDELMWRFLDAGLTPGPEEAGRIQRAAAALPPVLRDQLGPRLARRLQAEGFPDEARNLRDLLQRAATLPASALLRLDLDLGLAQPDSTATRTALAEALRDDGAEPVAAMTHAMAFDRGLGLAPDRARLDAARALLREHGTGPDTAALWQEVVLAHGARGEIALVLDLLGRDGVPPGARDAALTALFAERVAADDTAALLILARSHGADWQAGGSEAGRARVAAIARLRAAGLTEAAEILRGGQRMLILPARPGAPPSVSDPLREAWLGADWARLAGGATAPHAGIAARMVAKAEPSGPGAGAAEGPIDLSALAARVADSRDLRAELQALLVTPTPRATEAGR